MKTALLITAALLTAATANASQSRLSALGSPNHVNDVQDVFSEPSKVMMFNDVTTFEWGATTPGTGAPRAQGGFIKKMDDSAFGIYIGRKATAFQLSMFGSTASGSGGGINGAGATAGFTDMTTADVNPFDIFYGMGMGDMKVGLGLHYSNYDKKSTTIAKSNVMGLTASAYTDMWAAQLGLGLAGTASKDTGAAEDKVTADSSMNLKGTYNMDTMNVWLEYNATGAKASVDTVETAKFTYSDTSIGFGNSWKKDGADLYYQIAYKMRTEKNAPTTGGENKYEDTTMPLLIGVEAEAASWLVLRGSVTQNFFLGSKKTTTGGTAGESDSIADSMVTSAGLGFKWGKFMLDGSLHAASTGRLSLASDGGTGTAVAGDGTGDKFLTNAALTYTW